MPVELFNLEGNLIATDAGLVCIDATLYAPFEGEFDNEEFDNEEFDV